MRKIEFDLIDVLESGDEESRGWFRHGFPCGSLVEIAEMEGNGFIAEFASSPAETEGARWDIVENLIEDLDALDGTAWIATACGINPARPIHRQIRTLAAADAVSRTANEFMNRRRRGAKVLETEARPDGRRRVKVQIPLLGATFWVTDTRRAPKKR